MATPRPGSPRTGLRRSPGPIRSCRRIGFAGLTVLLLSVPEPGAAAVQAEPPAPQTTPAEKAASPEPTAPRAPLPPPGEMARCKALIDAGHHGLARARLEPIVAQHPGWARASLLLGLSYYRQHRFEAARPHFARALDADPDEVAVYPYYGYTLYALGELGEAGDLFRRLLERRPDYASGHYALARVHLDLDERKPAREHLSITIELATAAEDDVLRARAHARLGELLLREGDLGAARERLELALSLYPDEPGALSSLARVLDRQGEPETAAALRSRLEALDEGGRNPHDGSPE